MPPGWRPGSQRARAHFCPLRCSAGSPPATESRCCARSAPIPTFCPVPATVPGITVRTFPSPPKIKDTPVPDREHLDVHLQPLAGARFQPTGFPDVGPALFQRPVGEDGLQDCLLLESAQSMANHLEATSWDKGLQTPVPAFAGLPYVRVVGADGGYLTSSRTEAHRL